MTKIRKHFYTSKYFKGIQEYQVYTDSKNLYVFDGQIFRRWHE